MYKITCVEGNVIYSSDVQKYVVFDHLSFKMSNNTIVGFRSLIVKVHVQIQCLGESLAN